MQVKQVARPMRRLALVVAATAALAAVVVVGCGKLNETVNPTGAGTASIELGGSAILERNDVRVFPIKGSPNAVAICYVRYEYRNPRTDQVSLLTYDEANRRLADSDVVGLIETWTTSTAAAVSADESILSTLPDRPGAAPASGGDACSCWCMTKGDDGICRGTWGCVKECGSGGDPPPHIDP